MDLKPCLVRQTILVDGSVMVDASRPLRQHFESLVNQFVDQLRLELDALGYITANLLFRLQQILVRICTFEGVKDERVS